MGVVVPFISPEKMGDLGEAAVAYKLPDGVAAIEQPAVGAVDEGKRCLPREDTR